MEQIKKDVFIVGHKNPDTDSICSAIAYAALKRKLTGSDHFIPKRAGEINNETRFVLKTFGMEEPALLDNVSTQVSDIEIKHLEGVSGDMTIRRAYEMMKEKETVTLAITENDTLEGLITISDVAASNMDVHDNRIIAKADTPYQAIAETLDGKIIVGDGNAHFNKGKVIVAAANPDLMENYIEDNDMVIMGNRFESQFLAIEMKAGCIIVCVGAEVTPTIKRVAEEKSCIIISTPYDTYTAVRLVSQSMPIKYFMAKDNLIAFHIDDYTNDIKEAMANYRHRYFPVLDQEDRYCGLVSKRSFIGIEKKKVILVDHNEKTQAVDGIEYADILEIIDHHRLGNLETMAPVFFRNQPLGCTATIITQMYQENGIPIEPQIAGLLCAAILSDTLAYRSPTCTAQDRQAAEELAKLAGIEPEQFSIEMFSAGSDLRGKTPEEIFYQDFKIFTAGEITFGAGQINSMNEEELQEIKEKLIHFMAAHLGERNTDMLLFMLTNILEESTELLFVGNRAKELLERAFSQVAEEHSIFLPRVVSRKKQLVPAIINTMQQ